jgi:sugar phosphate isomerase/epimerase
MNTAENHNKLMLGFVSAILPELSFEEVLKFAAEVGYQCVEVMCWPVGKAERRYAGVTHIDVNSLGQEQVKRVEDLTQSNRVQISSLGYYPNPLCPDRQERQLYAEHIRKVIEASARLGIKVMTTFVGRDQTRLVDEHWTLFQELWQPIVTFAEEHDVRIGIENCPMLFSRDEWPGGKNLAISPEVWRRMFELIPSKHFGLNFDPSHLVWQKIDYVRALREFRERLVHVHAKDDKILPDELYEKGVLGLGWHIPKLPGLGDVQWGPFFSALTDTGYRGPVCVEVEDRAYEYSLEGRKDALRQSYRFLSQFFGRGRRRGRGVLWA